MVISDMRKTERSGMGVCAWSGLYILAIPRDTRISATEEQKSSETLQTMELTMAKVIKDKEERDRAVELNTKIENQFAILHHRIRELEDQLRHLSESDTAYNHGASNFATCMGRTNEQFEELDNIIKLWTFKSNSRSEVTSKIEAAPLKLRDKLIMMFLFTAACPPNRGGGDDGPAAVMNQMLRRMFGG
jgi:exonuclease VII small subunit